VSATTPALRADGTHVALDKRMQRNIMIAMITALIAVLAAMSGLNVAQQQMAVSLGASQGAVLWIINAYTVALAALLLPVGAIGDRYGRKTVLLTGLAVFGLATVGSLLATTTLMMIVARVIAGAGAAMIMPVTLSIITSSFPPEDKGKAIGIWAAFAGGGSMIAMFVSAFMIDALTWRWVFVLPLLLVAVSAVTSVLYAPNTKESSAHRFDTVGSIASAVAIGGLVLGIHEGPERGWTAPLTVAALIVGVVSVVFFVSWERRQAEPLLDISTFRDRGLAAGTVTLLIVFAVMFGVFLVLFPYFQAVLGWTALKSAAALLPMMLVMMPMSTIAPRLAKTIGRRTTMIAGVTVFAFGLVLMALRASVEGGYTSVLPGLIVIGLGMGLTMTPATEVITETLPLEKQGVASALNDTSRELGGAVGIALLGSVLTAGYKSAIAPALIGLPPELAHPAAEGIGTALAVAGKAGDQGPAIVEAAKHAFVQGWTHSMWLGVGMAAAALLFLIVRGPSQRTVTEPVEADELVSVG
jgi:EmrB/QacA subfamily drug resistance transporter